ncbi:MAG: hypothetical protein SFV15_15335 [Polyangiaceae bacterium]|nr:hypothetical protein [Polyangiaceae bacterium]
MTALKPGVESFLGQFFASSLEKQWRTPADFLRHFGPTQLITALADAPEVRSRLLVEAAGVHARIAAKKSPESAIEDLQIALDEGVASAEMIVGLFPADDQARYLPRPQAWRYLIEQPFWSDGRADSVSRVTFVVSTAVDEGLLTLEQVLKSLNIDALVDVLPPAELRTIMRFGLELGRQNQAVTELGILELLSMEKLFGFSSVERLWQELIVELVAVPCGLVEASPATPSPEPTSKNEVRAPEGAGKATSAKAPGAVAPSPATPTASAASADAVKAPASATTAEASNALPDAAEPEPAAPSFDELFEEVGEDDEMHAGAMVENGSEVTPSDEPATAQEAAPASGSMARSEPDQAEAEVVARTPQEEQSRERAAERLRGIDRLPPNWNSLPTPVLLSVDSMYAELVAASTDEAREEIIRDSFPNESILRTAMLAVIELLDPNIDTRDAVISDADVDSLISVVVFEERLRYEQATAAAAAPPAAAARRVSSPPPLPVSSPKGDNGRRASGSPPPLPRPGALGGSASVLKKAR